MKFLKGTKWIARFRTIFAMQKIVSAMGLQRLSDVAVLAFEKFGLKINTNQSKGKMFNGKCTSTISVPKFKNKVMYGKLRKTTKNGGQ